MREWKLDSVVARLQKAEDLRLPDLQMEIEKLLNDDDEEQVDVDAQGAWFDMVRERIHSVKISKSKIRVSRQRKSVPPLQFRRVRHVRPK